jgi:hypothetical protein
MNSLAQNIMIGLVSIPIYANVSVTTEKSFYARSGLLKSKNDSEAEWVESCMFGLNHALVQQFMPPIINDDEFQKIIINPLIATLIQQLLKDGLFKVGTSSSVVKTLMTAISSSAIVLTTGDTLFN